MKTPEIEKRYSGELSRDFWDLIKAIGDENFHDELYRLGCDLQTLEATVLRKLEKAINNDD